MRVLFTMYLLLFFFVSPSLSKPICQDGREKMVCDETDAVVKNNNLLGKIKIGFKKLFEFETEVKRDQVKAVDQKLERLRVINLKYCRMHNACVQTDSISQNQAQLYQLLLMGEQATGPSRAKGLTLEDKKVQNFLEEVDALLDYYDHGIPDDHKSHP